MSQYVQASKERSHDKRSRDCTSYDRRLRNAYDNRSSEERVSYDGRLHTSHQRRSRDRTTRERRSQEMQSGDCYRSQDQPEEHISRQAYLNHRRNCK